MCFSKTSSLWETFQPTNMTSLQRRVKPYGLYRNPSHVDRWHANAIKQTQPQFWEDTKPYTQQPGSFEDFITQLSKYDQPYERRKMPLKWLNSCKSFLDELRLYAFPRGSIPVWSIEASVKALKKNRGAGFPYFQKKGLVLKEVTHKAYTYKGLAFRNIPIKYDPVILAMRGALVKKEEPKTRVIWSYSAATTVIEGCFAAPLINAWNTTFMAPTLVGRYGLAHIREVLSNSYRYLQGWDWKSFDTTVPPVLVDLVFEFLYNSLDFSRCIGTTGVITQSDHEQIAFRRMFHSVRHFFTNTVFAFPDGRLFIKHGGVPSGSYFTNLVDSLVNYLLLRLGCRMGGFMHSNIYVNGDDSAFRTQRPFGKYYRKLRSRYLRVLGMELHSKKSQLDVVNKDLFVISGSTWPGLSPFRSDFDLFNMLLHPKTYVADIETSFGRLIGVFFAGGFRSERFCTYFHAYQRGYDLTSVTPRLSPELENLLKYGLGLAIPDLRYDLFKYLYKPHLLYSRVSQ